MAIAQKTYQALGPRSAALIARTNAFSAQNYAPYPFVVDKARGAWLYDADGNAALDFLSAYSAVLSHCHPGVVDAVMKEMHQCDLVSRALYTRRFADFVEKVAEVTGYERVLPKSDGVSATDTVVKGMFRHGHARGMQHPQVILTENYFHGRSWLFASNALFDADQSLGCIPQASGIIVVPDSPEAVMQAITSETIGLFVETHKGEGGPLFSTPEHFLALRKLAKDKGIFFGADEIQTGLGRCGYLMAWQEYGEEARPDVVTLGKALGGGIIPVSAIVGTEEFMRIYSPGSEGSTFGGYPLACAAACASLKYIVEEGIPQRAKELGDYLAQQLKEIPGIRTEHRGLLMRVELVGVESAKPACLEMLLGERNPRVFMKHGHTDAERKVAYARIAPPPGALTKELIDEAVERTLIPVFRQASQEADKKEGLT